jgi:hypothetical protein
MAGKRARVQVRASLFEICFRSHKQVFRTWNKRPNQLIIVGGAWRGSRYVLRLAALNLGYFG